MGNYREVRGGYQSASSGFRLLGKIPAGAITEQKREVQHPVERPYVNTSDSEDFNFLCAPKYGKCLYALVWIAKEQIGHDLQADATLYGKKVLCDWIQGMTFDLYKYEF